MGNFLSGIGQFLGPIGTVFHVIVYEPIYNVLMLIYNGFHATGIYGQFALSILVLTLIIRSAMIPLTRRQLKSSRAMQELAPQINELRVQYRGDPQGLMQAQQALYKEHGYSPAAGCLPLLIQMPFLYGLYFSFNTILRTSSAHETVAQHLQAINNDIYPFLPHLTHLPATQFFWTDLAGADPLHILPVLAGFFTLIQLRMAMPVRKKPVPGAPTDPTAQATQTTMYIMPLITVFFGWALPSGLALYWTIGAIFASVQQYFLTGWGSLFLGIPGMEHLVPEPKPAPGAGKVAVAAAGTRTGGARAGAAGARGLVATPPAEEKSEGGLRGLFRQVRDQAAAAQTQAAETAKARQEARIVEETPEASQNGNGAKPAGSVPKMRPRAAAKAAPTLVKPAAKAELPEQAIQREATSPALPEVAIANTASNNRSNNGNTSNGKNGNSSNSSNSNGARKPASNNNTNGKGASATRNRNTNNGNRPKGGR